MQKVESVHILGVRIDNVTFDEAIERALQVLKGKKQTFFTTPNPEICLRAHSDSKYRDILNKSELNTPDGTGLLKLCPTLKERVTGSDLSKKLIQLSKKHAYSIFFLGASEESNRKTAEYATQNGALIAGRSSGDPDDPQVLTQIVKAEPDLILIAYGATRQEEWIMQNLTSLPSIKLAIGIGGSFDFISGTRTRAPKWMQKLSLEWLFRLIQEPSRWRRIWNAVVIFPLTVFFYKD